MFPITRPFHPSVFGVGITSRFPAWMKIRESDSVGFRFTDALVGNELEFINNTLGLYTSYISLQKSPIDAMETLYQVDLSYPLSVQTIMSDGDIPIKVVENNTGFLSNLPTRIVYTGNQIIPSGLSGNIVGLEWMEGFPSGSLIIKQGIDEILPSSLMYYNITSQTNVVNPSPVSGLSFGIGYVGLGHNSTYEANTTPESKQSLQSKYPSGVWVSPDGSEGSTFPSGLVWAKQSFYDPITGIKTYYNKSLNNPYGQYVYDQADIPLTFEPISGTVKVYDVFNLMYGTSSGIPNGVVTGLPTDIPSSGLNVYEYIFNGTDTEPFWVYRGFDSIVPWEILPDNIKQTIKDQTGGSGIGPVATAIDQISWRILPYGGYVDDEILPHSGTFKWIDGPGTSGNIIRFSGGFSKYDIQYAYRDFSNITQISADKLPYKAASLSGDNIFFITGNDKYNTLAFETSNSNPYAIRLDPYSIRPGVMLNYSLLISTNRSDVWNNTNTQDKTIQFFKHNLGYTDDLGYKYG